MIYIYDYKITNNDGVVAYGMEDDHNKCLYFRNILSLTYQIPESMSKESLQNYLKLIRTTKLNSSWDGCTKRIYRADKRQIEFVFDSLRIYNRVLKVILKLNLLSNQDPLLQFLYSNNLQTLTWYRYTTEEHFIKTIELVESTLIPPLRLASFDIECTRFTEDGKFPNFNNLHDQIIQIGITYSEWSNDTCYYRQIITLDTCDPVDGVEVITCCSEEDVILCWAGQLHKHQINLITGYNINSFDFTYIYERAKLLEIDTELLNRISWTKQPAIFDPYHHNYFVYKNHQINIPGVVNIDLLYCFRTNKTLPKLKNNKLKTVAQHYTTQSKGDVSPDEIFALQKKTSADRKIIAEYCVQDCALCNLLWICSGMYKYYLTMTTLYKVPFRYLFHHRYYEQMITHPLRIYFEKKRIDKTILDEPGFKLFKSSLTNNPIILKLYIKALEKQLRKIKVHFNVPYRDIKLAKSMGAKWDHESKEWFADKEDVRLKLSKQWKMILR